MESIEELGLLQPVTVTPDGVLVCGWRRLEAVRRLGWRTLKVWVRSGISDQLSHLLAQQDENEQRKPLTPVETARALRRDQGRCEKEDARAATGSHAVRQDRQRRRSHRCVRVTGPPRGKTTLDRAHSIVTGTDASQRLERINWIRSVAEDDTPGRVRARVRRQHADRDRQRRTGRSGVQAREGRRRAGQQAAPSDQRRAGRGHPARSRSAQARPGGGERQAAAGAPEQGQARSHVITARGRSP